MSNKGVLAGVAPSVWQRYKPRIKCVGGTDPVLDDPSPLGQTGTGGGATIQFQTGQWLLQPNGLIEVMVQIQFLTNGTIGSGGPYAFSLPFPAHRMALSDGTCPIPIGWGMSYLSFLPAPQVNVEVVPTLADPHPSLEPDMWFQAYAPYCVDWGTITNGSSNNTITVSHNLGFAFDPRDLDIAWGTSMANAWWPQVITSVSSTDFVVASRGSGTPNIPAGTGYYKVRADPPSGASGALISPTVPFAQQTTGPFSTFFFQLEYRPRR